MYALHCHVFLLVTVYAVINPLIVPFGAIYFGLAYVVERHNVAFVYAPTVPCEARFGRRSGRRLFDTPMQLVPFRLHSSRMGRGGFSIFRWCHLGTAPVPVRCDSHCLVCHHTLVLGLG